MNTEWRKSSLSEPNGNQCVEVAFGQVAVGLRDSKNPIGGHLTITPAAFDALVTTFATTDDGPR